MAYGILIDGVIRQVGQDLVPAQNNGTVIQTGIAISAKQLSRVRGQLIITTSVGVPTITATASVVNRHLAIVLGNAAGGTAFTYILDLELTQSSQQGTRAGAAVIEIVNGVMGAAAPLAQNLAQTYDFGVNPASQTMTIADAKGGGVLVDASQAGATIASVFALEVRQNAAVELPVLIARRGNIAAGPVLAFDRARGNFAGPAANSVGDELGRVDFYGYPVGAFVLSTQIVSKVLADAGNFATDVQFWVTPPAGAMSLAANLNMSGAANCTVLSLHVNPEIVSDVDGTGLLGRAALKWSALHVQTANVYVNVCMSGTTPFAGTTGAVLFDSTVAVLPAPQADQVYVAAHDWTPNGGGIIEAALAGSAEAQAAAGQAAVDYTVGIPFTYNGVDYYLLARDLSPA